MISSIFLDACHLYVSPIFSPTDSLNQVTDWLPLPSDCHIIGIRKRWNSLYGPLPIWLSSSTPLSHLSVFSPHLLIHPQRSENWSIFIFDNSRLPQTTCDDDICDNTGHDFRSPLLPQQNNIYLCFKWELLHSEHLYNRYLASVSFCKPFLSVRSEGRGLW